MVEEEDQTNGRREGKEGVGGEIELSHGRKAFDEKGEVFVGQKVETKGKVIEIGTERDESLGNLLEREVVKLDGDDLLQELDLSVGEGVVKGVRELDGIVREAEIQERRKEGDVNARRDACDVVAAEVEENKLLPSLEGHSGADVGRDRREGVEGKRIVGESIDPQVQCRDFGGLEEFGREGCELGLCELDLFADTFEHPVEVRVDDALVHLCGLCLALQQRREREENERVWVEWALISRVSLSSRRLCAVLRGCERTTACADRRDKKKNERTDNQIGTATGSHFLTPFIRSAKPKTGQS